MLPVTIITGFLGAGKTTLLAHLVRAFPKGRVAVVVGDLSEQDVNAETLERGHALTPAALVNLHGGTLSGRLRARFRAEVHRLACSGDYDHLIVETSGAEDPAAVVAALTGPMRDGLDVAAVARVDSLVAVLDAFNFARDFGTLDGFAIALRAAMGAGSRSAVVLLAAGLQAADTVVLTKTDLAPPDALREATRAARALNPSAHLVLADRGRVAPGAVVGTGRFRSERFAHLLGAYGPDDTRGDGDGGGERALGIGASVFRGVRPLHPARLMRLVQTGLPRGLYRAKGFVHLASRPDHVLMLQVAGGRVDLERVGYWKAALLEAPERAPGAGPNHPGAPRLVAEERAALASALADPLFGDRHNELTLIGTDAARRLVLGGLERCLLTGAEAVRWRRRAAFEDPWPTRERTAG